MKRLLIIPGVVLALAAVVSAPSVAVAQAMEVRLTERGAPVPLDLTEDRVAMGRGLAHGLLASAHEDVTRPVTDAEVAALGRRGTLLEVTLPSPEPVLLLRLMERARASRLAAYVPPDRDDRAFVFLGRGSWERIVVVSLPEQIRTAVRRIRSRPPPAPPARPGGSPRRR